MTELKKKNMMLKIIGFKIDQTTDGYDCFLYHKPFPRLRVPNHYGDEYGLFKHSTDVPGV